jgi:hypothetical protein
MILITNKKSALYTLYDSAIISGKPDETEVARFSNAINEPAERLVDFSVRLFGNVDEYNFDQMTPLVPYPLYQSAIIQYRLLKQTSEPKYRENLESLKRILGYFSRRWIIAEKYLEALETFKTDWPVTIFPLEGGSVSARGPTGLDSR